MPVFVNLPLSYAHHTPQYVEMFLARGVNPELGMDTFAVQDLPLRFHQETAARFHDAGLRCAVHLPFFDLSPGSMNDRVLAATRDTIRRAAELAALYTPAHLVGHPHHNRGEHAPHMARWLERSTETWRTILDTLPGVPLFLENTFDLTPQAILTLLEELAKQTRQTKQTDTRTGFCLDIGHWHTFARGWQKQDLDAWLTAIGSRLGHLHLHDNDGSDDQHAGLGAGTIPLEELFNILRRNEIRPSATLEPHDEGAFNISRAYLKAHPDSMDTLSI